MMYCEVACCVKDKIDENGEKMRVALCNLVQI